MCRVLNYPRSTYYDKQKEKPENKWKSENKKFTMKAIRSMVPLKFVRN